MMLKEDAKKFYHSIPIPQEFHQRMADVIANVKEKENRTLLPTFRTWTKRCGLALVACFALFTLSLNVSPVFAENVSSLPVIGDLAKLVTFRSYEEDDVKIVDIRMPSLHNTGNSELEDRINYDILQKMEKFAQESEQMAQEYYDAFIATGGKKEDFLPILIYFDYDIKYWGGDKLSFTIIKSETAASVYTEMNYYNVDMETGKDITLEQLFGPNYKELLNQEIKEQIAYRTEHNENEIFFDGDLAFQTIADDQNFYLKDDHTAVIVFDKYEIAPGYMGFVEFEVAYS